MKSTSVKFKINGEKISKLYLPKKQFVGYYFDNKKPITNPTINPIPSGSIPMRRVPYWTAIGPYLSERSFIAPIFRLKKPK